MKYCRKCGMLLEDTHEHCIRCGADVTMAENVSMYPIEVMETIEEENKRARASGKLVAMIIALVVVLTGLVIFFLYALSGGVLGRADRKVKEPDAASATAEVAAPEEEIAQTDEQSEEAVEPAPEPEPTPTPAPESDKKVKDDKGVYYDYVTESDDAGNVIFTALVPEDLKEREFFKDTEGYCDRYPFTMSYTAATPENDVRFTYLSPRKFWYKLSDTGKGRSDERDLTHYMTYFAYENDRSYLEAVLSQSYPGAKFEIVDEYEVSPDVTEKLDELGKAKKKELKGDIGDYAYIGDNTSYMFMNYEVSAKVYEYEITLKDKDMLFCKYYVPSMAHNLTYANGDTDDRGTVTEWYNFALICFETGNEDEFDDYEAAFDVFVDNALPTNLFMFINETYCKDIKKGIADNEDVDPLDKSLLEKIGKGYKPDTKLDDFDAAVMDILRSAGPGCFSDQKVTVYTPESDKIAFYSEEKSKVFLSPEEDEYPGDAYVQLSAAERTAQSGQEQSSDEEGSDESEEGDGGAGTSGADDKPEGGGII